MDPIAWVLLTVVGVTTVVLVALGPRLKRDQMRRRLNGTAGGSLGGLGAGFDAVWRPSAEDAHAEWEAQVQLPAPAPAPRDVGRFDDGRIVIEVERAR